MISNTSLAKCAFSVAGLIATAAIVLLASTPLIALSQPRTGTGALPLQLVGDYPLPGATTRWDYVSHDPGGKQLFIAHLGDSAVVVMNTQTRVVTATIGGIGQVHGTLVVPELGRMYASATQTNEVVVIDTTTLKTIARIPGGVYPDGLAYAPDAGKLYVSDQNGKTETVIDVRTNKRIATLDMQGSVGNSQYDPVSKHIFVNVQGRGELFEINPATDAIVDRIPLPGTDGNHGLLIEPRLRLALIACEGNDKLLVLNLNTKKIVSTFSVGKDPDVIAYDAALGTLYVAGEAGVLSVFKVSAAGVSKIGEGYVGPNAHSLAVDPASHEVYFPLKDVAGRSVMRVMKPSP
ncbi:MAG: chrZ [Massilia sp.]|nr:chrZ [Massilia sp.]